MRSQYAREKKKIKQRKTGDGLEDAYITKWIYFNKLEFLDDHVVPKQSTSNYNKVYFNVVF